MKKLCGFLLLFCSVAPLGAQRIPETVIKVGIFQQVGSFNLSCESRYYFYEMSTGEQTDIMPGNDYLVKAEGNALIIDGDEYSAPLRIVSQDRDSRLRINGKRYRDNIMVMAKNGKMTIINELGIEDYIYGILPSEVSPSWPAESLKAQAIASRTYALKNLRRHDSAGFDICTQTHCQVYGGVETEDERTNKAVEETRGQVLVYNGQLAQTLFHASCGGHTENPKSVWNWDSEPPAYLRGVRDSFCSNSPHQNWKKLLSASFLKTRLVKAGYDIGDIKKIQLQGRNSSGRTRVVKISGTRKTVEIQAAKFRMVIDPWFIRSTWFTRVDKEGDGFVFTGRGWGHGAGLCQWGAKEMAEHGRSSEKILETYYPGAKVETWEE